MDTSRGPRGLEQQESAGPTWDGDSHLREETEPVTDFSTFENNLPPNSNSKETRLRIRNKKKIDAEIYRGNRFSNNNCSFRVMAQLYKTIEDIFKKTNKQKTRSPVLKTSSLV